MKTIVLCVCVIPHWWADEKTPWEWKVPHPLLTSKNLVSMKMDATLKDLVAFKAVYNIVVEKALNIIKDHLWSLPGTLVALSLFDYGATNETKNKIVSTPQNDGSDHPLEKVSISWTKSRSNKKPWKCCLQQLKELGLEMAFMDNNVDNWNQEESYRKNIKVVKSFRVMNDMSERGALIEEYSKLITKNEELTQFLVQVFRLQEKFPDRNKETLPYSRCFSSHFLILIVWSQMF